MDTVSSSRRRVQNLGKFAIAMFTGDQNCDMVNPPVVFLLLMFSTSPSGVTAVRGLHFTGPVTGLDQVELDKPWLGSLNVLITHYELRIIQLIWLANPELGRASHYHPPFWSSEYSLVMRSGLPQEILCCFATGKKTVVGHEISQFRLGSMNSHEMSIFTLR